MIGALDWRRLAEATPPSRDWAIEGWLGMDHPTLLAGLGGIGKTLVAQTAAAALSLGRDYIGPIPTPRRVLLWGCEDDHDEFWRRQIAIAEYFSVPLEAFADNLIIVPRVGKENTLLAKGFDSPLWTPVWGELIEQVNDYKIDVLMVDNVGQTCANEIDRHTVTKFVNAFCGIRPGLATLLLAHPAKANGSEFSGSTAWENAVRMRWYLGTKLPDQPEEGADPSDDVRYLCKRKTNYSAKDYVRLNYREGVLVPDTLAPAFDARFRADIAERIVLKSVAKLKDMGKFPIDGQTSPEYLPKLIVDFKMQENMTKRELTDAMRSLMVAGRLQRQVAGQYTNRSARYALVPA